MLRLLELEGHATHAETDAKRLLRDLADAVLASDERDDLADHAAQVAAMWTTVADAVRNPIAGDAERYLRSV